METKQNLRDAQTLGAGQPGRNKGIDFGFNFADQQRTTADQDEGDSITEPFCVRDVIPNGWI